MISAYIVYLFFEFGKGKFLWIQVH